MKSRVEVLDVNVYFLAFIKRPIVSIWVGNCHTSDTTVALEQFTIGFALILSNILEISTTLNSSQYTSVASVHFCRNNLCSFTTTVRKNKRNNKLS